MSETPLADLLFNPTKVELLASDMIAARPDFPAAAFAAEVNSGLAGLKLKQRISWISECLARHLPTNYRSAVTLLLDTLPPPLDPALSDGDFGDFIYAPYSECVARHGTATEDLDFSLDALRQITMRFSAEDAVRAFINADSQRTLQRMREWASDDNYHVRRLASEGSRPRLPWSRRLVVPYDAGLPILDTLHADPTRYVTRSVANHLNDISKDDPELVIKTLQRWHALKRQQAQELEWLTRHALRSLIRHGHQGAMKLLGLTPVELAVSDFNLPNRAQIGKPFTFSFALTSAEAVEVLVDYAIYFQDAKGVASRRKVFKLGRAHLEPAVACGFRKVQVIRADLTTRRVYPGQHRLELLVNGHVVAGGSFELDVT